MEETQVKYLNMHLDEKTAAALASILAAVFLIGLKLVVGILTGSLGILSEALHSTLDFVAAGITFIAVRTSGKPADQDHQYGHGKIENFSALIETLLLFITVVWIIYEATKRIILQQFHVEANIYAFLVVILAIIIDASRASMLYKTAKKYDSQALKADALHYSTDILSSSVVFIGLVFIKLGYPIADPIAAIGVAFVVLWVTLRLGKESVGDLLDRAPKGLEGKIRAAVVEIIGLSEVRRVRIRKSGPETFVDLTAIIEDSISVETGYHIIEQMISRVKTAVPGKSDVVVHLEPITHEPHEELLSKVNALISMHEMVKYSHDTAVIEVRTNQLTISSHVEVDEQLTLQEVDAMIQDLKIQIQQLHPTLTDVILHVEPFLGKKNEFYDKATQQLIAQILPELVVRSKFIEALQSYNIVELAPNAYSLVMKCNAAGEHHIRRIHKASTELEESIKDIFPFFKQVLIQTTAK